MISAPMSDELEFAARKASEARDNFTLGYLIAVANMANLHGCDVVAEDTLSQLGETEAVIERFDLGDYDAKPLRKLFREISRKKGIGDHV